MTNTEIGDETLMAFADGALDEPLFSRVAEAVETDAALAARLEALVDGAALARAAFGSQLQPVSPELEASVRRAIARAERKPFVNAAWWRAWLFPLAGFATAAVLTLVALPPFLAPAPSPPFGSTAIAAALDSLPSGDSRGLPDGTNIAAVASFFDAGGTLCREFETGGFTAIACREDSDWRVALAVASGGGEGGYRPASGLAAIDLYLEEIGAGAPLLDGDEAAALASSRPPRPR